MAIDLRRPGGGIVLDLPPDTAPVASAPVVEAEPVVAPAPVLNLNAAPAPVPYTPPADVAVDVDPSIRRASQAPENQPEPSPPPVTMPSSYTDPRYDRAVQSSGEIPGEDQLPPNLNDTDYEDLRRAQRFSPIPGAITGDAMQTTRNPAEWSDTQGKPLFPDFGSATAQTISARRPVAETPTLTTEIPEPVAPAAPATSTRRKLPFEGEYAVTTPFGEKGSLWTAGYHPGVDYATPMNTPLYAEDGGVVESTGRDPSYGINVRVKYPWGTVIYGHLNRADVRVGESVQAGAPLGLTGSTGKSTGPHLHREVRVNGQIVDPASVDSDEAGPQTGGGTKYSLMSATAPIPSAPSGNAPDVAPAEPEEAFSPPVAPEMEPTPQGPRRGTSLTEELTAGRDEGLFPAPSFPGLEDVGRAIGNLPLPFSDRFPSGILPQGIEPGATVSDFVESLKPPRPTPDASRPFDLDQIMDALPAVGNVPAAIGVKGVGTKVAMAADVISNLLAGPSVQSFDDVLRVAGQLAARGVEVSREQIADAAAAVAQRAERFGMELAGIDPNNPTGPRSATLGANLGNAFVPRLKSKEAEIAKLQEQASSAPDDEALTQTLTQIEKASQEFDQLTGIGSRASQLQQTADQIEQANASSPVRSFVRNLVASGGANAGGVPEDVSLATYEKMTGHRGIGQANINKRGRIPIEIAVDEPASDAGMTADEFLAEVNRYYRDNQRLAATRRELRALDSEAKGVQTAEEIAKATQEDLESAWKGILGTGEQIGTRPRQTYASLQESPLDTPVIRELLTGDPYVPIRNADVMRAASERIDANPEQVLRRVLDENAPLDANGIAQAFELTRRAVASGNVDAIRALAKRIGSEGTDLGQRLQLYREIDKLTPEGATVELFNNFEKLMSKNAKRARKVASQADAAIIRQRADTQIAAIDAIRTRSSKPARTVQEAVTNGSGMLFNDFLKGMADLLREPGVKGRGSQTGALRAGPLVEVDPDAAARFFARGEEIKALTDPAERATKAAELLEDIRAYRDDIIKTQRSEAKAAQVAERIQKAHAERQRRINQMSPEDAEAEMRSQARGEATQARQEVQAEKRVERQATSATRKAAEAELTPVERLERDRLTAEKAAADRAVRSANAAEMRAAKERQRQADAALAKWEREQAKAAIEAPKQAPLSAAESLERQKQASLVSNAASLERQRVRETEAEALARESGIQYLTDREARAAKEQIKRTMEEEIKTAQKRYVKEQDITLSPEIAANFRDRATALRNMPMSTPREKYDQYIAGRQLMSDLSRFAPPSRWRAALEAYNLPRSLLTTLDNSYAMSQGGLMMLSSALFRPTHALSILEATSRALTPDDIRIGIPRTKIGKTFSVGKSLPWESGEEYTRNVEAQFLFGQHSKAMLESGLIYEDRFGNRLGSEFYPSNVLANAPGVRQSERAFNLGGNKDRMDYWRRVVNGWLPPDQQGKSFDSIKELAKATGKTEDDFRNLAKWTNALTFKLNTPKELRGMMQVMSGAFFAPSYFLAHFQAPILAANYAATSKALRPEIAKTVASLVVTMGATYALASQVPGVKIQGDPLASGYGDITWGPFHFNPLLGYGPIVHYGAMIATGKRHNVETNKEYTQPLGDSILEFLRSKLNVIPGEAWDFTKKTDVMGNPVRDPSPRNPAEAGVAQKLGLNPQERSGVENALRRISQDIVPMFGSDVADAIEAAGPAAALVAVPQFHGARINVYTTTRALQNQGAQRLGLGTDYAALNPLDRAKVDALPDVKFAYDQQDASSALGISDRDQVAVSMRNYLARKKAIEYGQTSRTGVHEPGLKDVIVGGAKGKVLADAIKDANRARYEAAQTSFNEYYEAAKAKPIAAEARDILREEYQTAPLEDPITGDFDYQKQKNIRATVLQKAAQLGIDPNYLTQTASPYADPVTQKADAEDRKAKETLRQYYDLNETVAGKYGSTRKAMEERPSTDYTRRLYERDLQDAKEAMRANTANGVEAAGLYLGKWQPLRERGGEPRERLEPLPPREPRERGR